MEGTSVSSGLTSREQVIYTGLSPLFRRNVRRDAQLIRERAGWSVEQLEAFRLERARATLRHAAATVPYYRELFARLGFVPSDATTFRDLQSIPPLTRTILRERFADLRSSAVPDEAVVRRSTGGTSGMPVTVVLDRAGDAERMLVNHRMYALMQRSLGTPTLMIAGSPIDSAAWLSARERAKNKVFGIDVLSSFDLTAAGLDEIVRRLESGRYPWVIAYASVFDILAARVAGKRLHIPNIIPCAEPVSQAQRERWRATFGSEIFEIYGSREMTSIAGELADHQGMAIAEDVYHVEILDEGGRALSDGEPGLITITTLGERGMPLLRYQLGDVGVLQPAVAGSGVPFRRLRITHGRILDVICCPNGKMLPGEFFPHLMKEVEASVERFQVVQTDLDRIVVRLVPRRGEDPGVAAYLRPRIEEQVGAGMRIDFELVEDIPPSPSGKHRPTISMLPESEKRFSR